MSRLPAVLVAVLAAVLARSGYAQSEIAPSDMPAGVTVEASSSSATPDSQALAPSDWYKIGGAWGPQQAWQVGFDKSATVGACGFIGAARGQGPKYIVGPCRDFFLVAKNKKPVYHLGILALGYDVSDLTRSHPYYLARLGVNVGPAASSFLANLADRVPYLEGLLDWQAPAPLKYLGKISTLDAGGGPGLHAKPVYGGGVKLDIPLEDLAAAVRAATGR
jgi:hypothetical protein